jgi:imidazole glycerol-phosphate synthase subunit HisH
VLKYFHVFGGGRKMIAIVDYGMGNVTSVKNGFAYVGFDSVLTDDLDVLRRSKAIVLPGVGAFGSAIQELARKGLVDFLRERERQGTIILGICLGLQLMFEHSEEDPGIDGLKFFSGDVVRFPPNMKVPQIGWNRVNFRDEPLFTGIPQGTHFYFANSYFAAGSQDEHLLAWGNYGVEFAAGVRKGNVFGLQFHPEKSGEMGLKLLLNFGRMVQDAGNTGN